MKSSYVWVAAATLLLAGPVVAQDASGPFMTSQGEDQHLAKDTLIGAQVYGKDGTVIGDIEDLILSDGNTVIGVVIGTGGFLGLNEKRVGLALSALQSESKDGRTIITVPLGHDDLVATQAYQRSLPKKSLLERAKEKAKELTDKTTETTKDAYEKAKPTIDQAKEKAKETYEKAKEKVEEAIGDKPAPTTEAPAPSTESAAPAPEAPAAPEAAAPEAAAPEAPAPAAPAATAPAGKVQLQPNEQPSWDERTAGQSIKLKTDTAPAEAAPAEAPAAPAADAPAEK